MKILPIFSEPAEINQLNNEKDRIREVLIEKHIILIEGIPGLSKQTRKTYLANLKHFIHYIQLNGIHAHSFADFRNELENVQKSLKTKNAYLTSAKVLLQEALKYRIIPVDITANVPGFKVARGHKKDGLSYQEVQKVGQYIRQIENDHKRAKLTAMYHLFALEGFRQIEVARLTIGDFKSTDGYILVHGKGRGDKEKHYLMDVTIKSLNQYITTAKIESGFMFPGRNGKMLTTRAIQKTFTDAKNGLFVKAGVQGKSVHGFRHFNITHTLSSTSGNVTKAAQRARLRTIETVNVYNDARLSREIVAELADSFGGI